MPSNVFTPADLDAAHARAGRLYHEFLRVPALSAGLYKLGAGAVDAQRPHGEDEIYVVVSGRGAIVIEGERRDVAAGDVIYVPARAAHRFVDIAEPLALLVVFAPAEGT